jgi:hypothetical protein
MYLEGRVLKQSKRVDMSLIEQFLVDVLLKIKKMRARLIL